MPSLDLSRLHAAAITAGLDRDALLSGIDKRFIASIPRSSSRAAQLLQDIHELHGVKRLTDGTSPLQTWLNNAVFLSEMRSEQATFREALLLLDPHWAATRAATSSQSTAAPVPTPADVKLRLYLSASSADRPLVERFRKHLFPVAASAGLEVWDRTQTRPGEPVTVADQKLAAANIVVLLVSSDFLASEETHAEANRARALRGPRTRLIPVLVRPCAWSSSPALAGLTILPRSGKAISSQSDVDAAFVAVVQEISAVVDDLLRSLGEGAAPAVTSPTNTRSSAKVEPAIPAIGKQSGGDPLPAPVQGAPAGMPLAALFERSGTPTRLYVEPAQARRIRASLRTPGRGLVLEGPSKIGKTTALRKALGDTPCLWLDAYSDEAQIRATIDERKLSGHLVIDNAHALTSDALAKLARWLRVEADDPAPRGKLMLACIPGTTRRLTATQRDLVGRIDQIAMQKQPTEKIRALVDLAERVGRLRFEHKAEIVHASLGSFQLAHLLCFECALASELELVPAAETAVASSLEEVRPEVQRSISPQFDDLALAFVKADAQTRTPGAGLAFLWKLSQCEDDGVALAKLRNEFPALAPAWDFWERAGHEQPSRAPAEEGGSDGAAIRGLDLREIAQRVAGSLVSEDPLFRFYLKSLDWGRFAERAGIAIEWHSETGDLLVPVEAPRSENMAVRQGAKPLYQETSYPVWRPEAVTVRDLLVGAYPTIESMQAVATMAGVNLGHFAPSSGAAEPAWNSLLEIATRQVKLEALMNKVLSDRNAGSYRAGIRSALGKLGVVGLEA